MLNGWKTIIVAVIWMIYEIAANAVPELQKPDRAVVESMVQAFLDIIGPLVVIGLRLITTGPVAWRKQS